MALKKDDLVNIVLFMERASKTLSNTMEHCAFAQTYQAVHKEIARLGKRAAKEVMK